MAEQKTLSGTLEMRYVPDEYTATEKAEGASWPLGAGYYDLGFVSDGAFFVIRRIHGGEVDKLQRLAKENQQQQQPEPTTEQPPPAAPTSYQTPAPPEQPQAEQPPHEQPPA